MLIPTVNTGSHLILQCSSAQYSISKMFLTCKCVLVQVPAIQTLATTEEYVRSARASGAIPLLATSASVRPDLVEFTANTVSQAISH